MLTADPPNVAPASRPAEVQACPGRSQAEPICICCAQRQACITAAICQGFDCVLCRTHQRHIFRAVPAVVERLHRLRRHAADHRLEADRQPLRILQYQYFLVWFYNWFSFYTINAVVSQRGMQPLQLAIRATEIPAQLAAANIPFKHSSSACTPIGTMNSGVLQRLTCIAPRPQSRDAGEWPTCEPWSMSFHCASCALPRLSLPMRHSCTAHIQSPS